MLHLEEQHDEGYYSESGNRSLETYNCLSSIIHPPGSIGLLTSQCFGYEPYPNFNDGLVDKFCITMLEGEVIFVPHDGVVSITVMVITRIPNLPLT